MGTIGSWIWRLSVLNTIKMTLSDYKMTKFKMPVGADSAATLHIATSSLRYIPEISFKNSHPRLTTGSWFFGTQVHLLPRTAGFLNKAIFPFLQHLSLSIGLLGHNSATKPECSNRFLANQPRSVLSLPLLATPCLKGQECLGRPMGNPIAYILSVPRGRFGGTHPSSCQKHLFMRFFLPFPAWHKQPTFTLLGRGKHCVSLLVKAGSLPFCPFGHLCHLDQKGHCWHHLGWEMAQWSLHTSLFQRGNCLFVYRLAIWS